VRAPLVLSAAALVVALAALVVGARAPEAVVVTAEPRDDDEDDGARDDEETADDGPDSERIAALEREVRALRREIAALAAVRSGVARDAQAIDSAPSVARPIDDDEGTALSEAVETKVQEALKRAHEEESARRDEFRDARWSERHQEQMRVMREEHGLDERTAQKIEAMLTAERQELAAVLQNGRENNLSWWREMRPQTQAVRAATDENVKALLDEKQAKAWDAQRDLETDWNMGRGGRRGGGGGQ